MITIGDIACTPTEVITPSGRAPIADMTLTFTDMTRTTRTIPVWAIVCAIVFFFFCFLGLLCLLAKEERTEGWVQVTVQSGRLLHVTQIPANAPWIVADINARVNYARALAFNAHS